MNPEMPKQPLVDCRNHCCCTGIPDRQAITGLPLVHLQRASPAQPVFRKSRPLRAAAKTNLGSIGRMDGRLRLRRRPHDNRRGWKPGDSRRAAEGFDYLPSNELELFLSAKIGDDTRNDLGLVPQWRDASPRWMSLLRRDLRPEGRAPASPQIDFSHLRLGAASTVRTPAKTSKPNLHFGDGGFIKFHELRI